MQSHGGTRSRAVRKTRTVRKSVIGLSTLALTVATFIPGASTASLSTIRPPCMTATRSAMPATTARS